MMKSNAALRIAITGANGNIGRKLIAAFLSAPDIAAIHAIDRDVASLAPHDARLFPIRADLRGPVLLDALAGVDRSHSFGGAESLSGRLMGRCERFL
jgi:nucleoside-diphosphate-sugar epimerase